MRAAVASGKTIFQFSCINSVTYFSNNFHILPDTGIKMENLQHHEGFRIKSET
jgi:hypothetical protein